MDARRFWDARDWDAPRVWPVTIVQGTGRSPGFHCPGHASFPCCLLAGGPEVFMGKAGFPLKSGNLGVPRVGFPMAFVYFGWCSRFRKHKNAIVVRT